MSDPILPLEVWQSGTNENSLPSNENSLRLEALSRIVISDSVTTQPANPDDRDSYIIPIGATGVQWATFDPDDLAMYVVPVGGGTGSWKAWAPVEGIVVNLDGALVQFSGSAGWTSVGGGSGGGDVVGPSSSTSDNIVVFDGATGKLIKDGGKTIVQLRQIEQNSQSTAYTLVLADAGKHILHPSADTTARTFTIPANSSVAFPVGTAVTFVNQNAAGAVTIAITTDTMRLAGAGSTGSRTLAANGIATALKITSTEWIISGTNLT